MISIIDGFELNASTPIDLRIVVADTTAKNAITYKYDGLRVFQLDSRLAYVWNDGGSTWDLEFNGVSATGTNRYIPVFSSVNTLVNSPIYVTYSTTVDGKVGINTNDPKEAFQLNTPFSGSEPFVINKGGSSTILGYNWYYNSGDQYFTFTKGSSVFKLADDGSITFGARAASSAATIIDKFKISTSTSNIYIPFGLPNGLISAPSLYFNSSLTTGIYSPSTNQISFVANGIDVFRIAATQIRLMNGTVSSPILSFSASTSTGIYSPAPNQMSFVANGTEVYKLASNQIRLMNGTVGAPTLAFSASTTTGIYSPASNQIAIAAAGSQRVSFTSTMTRLYGNGTTNYFEIDGTGGGADIRLVRVSTTMITFQGFISPNYSVISGPGTTMYILTGAAGGALSLGGSNRNNSLVISDSPIFVEVNANFYNTDTYDNTVASSANVNVDSAGLFRRSTSSIKYKKDIENLTSEYANKIYNMRPVYYKSKSESDNKDWSWYGLIAEELAEIDPRLVSWGYDSDSYEDIEIDGKMKRTLKKGSKMVPNGVQYDRLSVFLLKVIQDIRKELDNK